MTNAKLEFTGHPLIDVGLATIAAFSKKSRLEDVTLDDMTAIADYMDANYTKQPLRSYLTVVFPNSGYTQFAYFKKPELQSKYKDKVLRAFHLNAPRLPMRDAFMNLPVTAYQLDVKDELQAGMAFRQHIPLTNGEGVINFSPNGVFGMPVSGEALLAIQALPLGCAKIAGRLLVVHSDSPEALIRYTTAFVKQNLRAVAQVQLLGGTKMPENPQKLATVLIMLLNDLLDEQEADDNYFSLSAYHLTNSGQSADLAIHHLPNQIIEFLRVAKTAKYRAVWSAIVKRAWTRYKPKKNKPDDPDYKPSRNWVYEDLFDVGKEPRIAGNRFVRRYLLREPIRYARNTATELDPRIDYDITQEFELVSWQVTELFIRKIQNMETERITAIKTLAKHLAEYIAAENDRRLFQTIYAESKYSSFRNALIRANFAHVKRNNRPFLELDDWLDVFESGENLARSDWRYMRDLVTIRLIELLHKNGWLGANADAIELANTTATESE